MMIDAKCLRNIFFKFLQSLTDSLYYYLLISGADLSALVREASEFALKEFIKNPIPENEVVRLKHFELAFQKIKPSVSQKVRLILKSSTHYINHFN